METKWSASHTHWNSLRDGGAGHMSLVALLVWCVQMVSGDINFPNFSRVPKGDASPLRAIGGASLDYFSTEFDGPCPNETAPAIYPPVGLTQRFQHPEFRNDSGFGALPQYKYLDDNQLDNPYAGRIEFGLHTEVVGTQAFIPDDDAVPLPHNRTQLCHYALRLTPPMPKQNTATWYKFKQLVGYGFVTEFHFRILHRQKDCLKAGSPLTYCQLIQPSCEGWCQEVGGDGFAFVIQNNNRQAIGSQVNGLGYQFKKSLAIEFDTLRNPDFEELSGNHISVHVPSAPDQANSANHFTSEIAHSDDIPPLTEGTHVARIEYNPRFYSWDDLGRAYESDNSGTFAQAQVAGRAGLLTVELDGQRVITVPVDINHVVQIDNFKNYEDNIEAPIPPTYPNRSGEDEAGVAPGRAWVGFTSSTSYSQWQSVDILSWTLTEKPRCPYSGAPVDSPLSGPSAFPATTPHRAGDVNVTCRVETSTLRGKMCTVFGEPYCTLIVRNIARQPIRMTARLRTDYPWVSWPCLNGVLEWDFLHPYFLGCRRQVVFPHELIELQVMTLDGTRSATITDIAVLGKSPTPFTRRPIVEHCVMEHKYDLLRLYFAECNCQYCIRLLDLQLKYMVFFNDRCKARFGLICPCFEVSEVMDDVSTWKQIEPLQHLRLRTCRGCAYPSHCSQMLKVATCYKQQYQRYKVGNPLAPVPLANARQLGHNFSRDHGRVTDGMIYGDSCNCEPNIQPYRGDPDGRKGLCAATSERGVLTTVASLDGCQDRCAQTAKCAFFIYWNDGACRVYISCPWVLCTTMVIPSVIINCTLANVYRLAPLGKYMDTRGVVQEFRVYPVRQVQTTPQECFNCLELYDDQFCIKSCGTGLRVPYLHWPGGQSCGSCILAGNRFHELTVAETQSVKACVYEATRVGDDPWVACESTVQRIAGIPAIDLFNGVNTHFLSECPGRNFKEGGGVCVPNMRSRQHYGSQVLSRMAAMNNAVWGPELQCLNAVCQVVERSTCYMQLVHWRFDTTWDTLGTVPASTLQVIMPNVTVLNITSKAVNGTYVRPAESALKLNKNNEQYLVTEPLPFTLENNTLEAWIEIDPSEAVTDLALNAPALADTMWRDDYESYFANDGNTATYWSSQLGTVNDVDHYSRFYLELPVLSSVEISYIYWFQPPSVFEVHVSGDNVSWFMVHQELNNQASTTTITQFYVATYVRITMTRAAVLRLSDPGLGRPVYSIYEFEAMTDMILSRLKPTLSTYTWNWYSDLARDGDSTTYWASIPGVQSMDFFVDFGSLQTAISVIKLHWRFFPFQFAMLIGSQPCKQQRPATQIVLYTGAQITATSQDKGLWDAQCFLLRIDSTRRIWGEYLVGILEIDLRQEGANRAVNASVLSTDPTALLSHLTPIGGGLDGNSSTYFMMQPNPGGVATINLDLGAVFQIISIKYRWGRLGGFTYFPSWFKTEVGRQQDGSDFTVADEVTANFNDYRRFVLYTPIRYLRLSILGVMFTNPLGRFILEDWIIHATSDNIALRNTTSTNTTSEWSNCSICNLTVDGSNRIHGPHKAVDGDLSTWYGARFGVTALTSDTTDWKVIFDTPLTINVVVIRWKYPAANIQVFCGFNISTQLNPAGDVKGNTGYLTQIVFPSPRLCRVIQVTFAVNVESFAGHGVVGIQEVNVFNADTNLALNAPVITDTAGVLQSVTTVTDSSDQTLWEQVATNPVVMTADLQQPTTGWCIRTFWAFGKAPNTFHVSISNDNVTYTNVKSFSGNIDRDIYIISDFTARYVRVHMISPMLGATRFALRTLAVYGSANLALNKYTEATGSWNHTGMEAVDGINTTFWISEPLATTATLRVDLYREYFIGDGVRILWKFPAKDFSIHYNNANLTNWTMLYNVTNNLATYTIVQTNFIARYIEVRMTRPSLLNGDQSYAIYSFDVVFDPNLAHGKNCTADHTVNISTLAGYNAIDGIYRTIWMPKQNSDNSEIIFDLQADYVVSRMEISWGNHPPRTYRIYGQDVLTLQYVYITEFTTPQFGLHVDWKQDYWDGFVARRVKIMITEVAQTNQGKLCSLRDVLMYTFLPNNVALNKPVTCSQDIVGNPCWFATDGNIKGTYWLPGSGVRSAWIKIDVVGCPSPIKTGRTSIWWRFPAGHYMVEFYRDHIQGWFEVHREYNASHLFTDFFKHREMCEMRINIYPDAMTAAHDIGVFDVAVYIATPFRPAAVAPSIDFFDAPYTNINDLDEQSYWMAPPWTNGVQVYLDLGMIYSVYDIYIWFNLLPQEFAVWCSVYGFRVSEFVKQMTSTAIYGRMRLQVRGKAFDMRYLRLDLIKSYQDPEYQLGTVLRDIAVYQFRNLAEGRPTTADNTWSYPPQWSTDGLSTTWYMSRFNAPVANLYFDLGEDKNVAGVDVLFQYSARHFVISYSSDNVTWTPVIVKNSNLVLNVSFPSSQHHFKGRYVKLHMEQPNTQIFHPDNPGNFKNQGYVFALKLIRIWEHTGGGGTVGIQNLDGTEFNTIVWGQRQPGEWMIGSELDKYTEEVGGGAFTQDQGNPTHIAVTFQKVAPVYQNTRRILITMYRNGLPYGNPYFRDEPASSQRLRQPNQTRMVFGVRSTYFANISNNKQQIAGVHSLTHSAYFSGKIYNVTLLRNALSAEEVLGLYAVHQGGEEMGCHCYDACPVGYNRFNRTVPVPCSGQGICRRNPLGTPLSTGYCECLPGFSGLDCSNHCSELSAYGCCEVDDDCPSFAFCDATSKACLNNTR